MSCLVLALLAWGGPPVAPLGAQPAAAQVSFGGCYSPIGMIPSIADPNLRDVAMAMVHPQGGPLIVYNPYAVAMSDPAVQQFFYYHECAHHVLGHTIGAGHPMTNEQAADCWAVRELVGRGIFGPGEVQRTQAWIHTGLSGAARSST